MLPPFLPSPALLPRPPPLLTPPGNPTPGPLPSPIPPSSSSTHFPAPACPRSSARWTSSLPGCPQRAQGTQRPEHILFPWSPRAAPFALFSRATRLARLPAKWWTGSGRSCGWSGALCPRGPRGVSFRRESVPTWAPGLLSALGAGDRARLALSWRLDFSGRVCLLSFFPLSVFFPLGPG